jgi:autotransporter-associated beta strand protein
MKVDDGRRREVIPGIPAQGEGESVKAARLILIATLQLSLIQTVPAADVNDLYIQTGTDPTWQELLDNNAIPIGVTSTTGVQGSTINVLNQLVEVGPNANQPIISNLKIHTLGNSSVGRDSFYKWSRWYQEDGHTQVFRLFKDEVNVRNTRPNAARIESFNPSIAWVEGDGWQRWCGTYTIIKPTGAAIFQAKNSDNDWSVMINMNAGGDVTMNRRRGDDVVLATDMIGRAFDICVYDNGLDYLVFFNGVYEGDGSWSRPTGTTTFRWGMYMGDNVPQSDAMLFVTGANIATNVPMPQLPEPVYYWDNNGTTTGFGTAAGTWAAPTTGDATQGWSTSATGVLLPGSVTTATGGALNFGNGTTGLAAGTITVDGTVSASSLTFASGSGKITLDGGQITLAGTSIIDVNNSTDTINSVLAGAATKLTVASTGTLALNGLNTFAGQVVIGDNSGSSLKVQINTIKNVGGGASSLGAPTTAAKGIIQIGATSHASTLEFTGASAAASTNRQVQIGTDGTGSGGATILNNNADPSYTLTFSNAAFNPLINTSSFSRNLTLGGSNTGDNTIAGAIIEPDGSGKLGLVKSGTGTWILAGANTCANPTSINSGTLKMGADNVLPSGAGMSNVNVNGGANANSRGTLDLNGFDLAINGLVGTTDTVLGRVVNNATGTNKTLTVGNNNASATFAGIIADNTSGTGTIALTKVGTGTETLSGPNTYTGATTISGGTLALGASGSFSSSPTIAISSSGAVLDVTAQSGFAIGAAQTLKGIGAVNAGSGNILTVNGTLAPGNSAIGTLSVTGSTALGGTNDFEISKNVNVFAADKLSTSVSLTYGGTLKITSVGPDDVSTFSFGDSWDLFDGARDGTSMFSNDSVFDTPGDDVNLPLLGTGLKWTFDYDAGVLSVVSGIVPGDTNEDNVVDAADFITLKKNFGAGPGAAGNEPIGDFNSSGTVDWNDLCALTGNMGKGGPAPAATPEPATLGLLAFGALAVLKRRKTA